MSGERLSLSPRDTIEIVSSTPEELEVEASYAPGGSPPPAHHHPMWNPDEEPARVRWRTSPGGRTEEWFRRLDGLFSPQGALARGEGVDFQALLEEYDDVFRLDLD